MMNWEDRKDELTHALKAKRFGLITDVDGTISPIVDVPDSARVTPANLRFLSRLQKQLALVAIISGRAAEDVAHRVGLTGLVYVGNHGMETCVDGKVQVSAKAQAYRETLLEAGLEIKRNMLKGMRFEDKGVTLSVHYRQTGIPEKIAVELAPLMEDIARTHGLDLTQGRMVFEFRPPVKVDKGTAFEELIKTRQLDGAVFIGDDTTDIGAFQTARRLRESGQCLCYGLGVAAQGAPRAVLTEADFLVQEVAGVESFLGWLSKSCIASST